MIPLNLNLDKNGIMLIAVAVVAVAISIYIYVLHGTIDKLNDHISTLQVSLANVKLENARYVSILEKQNKAIEDMKLDLTKANESLESWKKQPREVKYRVIYKEREVKSNDCKDVKNTINSIRSLNFRSL
jgi:type II secretory pathway pseudopilin PulG